ncbi:hypothetical protein T484DRAFT_2855306 [Baffinella frigidus]|nr:hypothetical protein T484DRAFT_2855306 [Cryptophyta sp. CCMP2293]
MASVTEVTKKEMGKTFKHVQQLLGKTVQPTKPKDIVTRFCSNLGVSPELENLAIAISDAAASININEGRVYTSVAGAAIWMACLLRAGTKDQRSCLEIAHATGAAEATIRQTFRELHQVLIPPAIGFSIRLGICLIYVLRPIRRILTVFERFINTGHATDVPRTDPIPLNLEFAVVHL